MKNHQGQKHDHDTGGVVLPGAECCEETPQVDASNVAKMMMKDAKGKKEQVLRDYYDCCLDDHQRELTKRRNELEALQDSNKQLEALKQDFDTATDILSDLRNQIRKVEDSVDELAQGFEELQREVPHFV